MTEADFLNGKKDEEDYNNKKFGDENAWKELWKINNEKDAWLMDEKIKPLFLKILKTTPHRRVPSYDSNSPPFEDPDSHILYQRSTVPSDIPVIRRAEEEADQYVERKIIDRMHRMGLIDGFFIGVSPDQPELCQFIVYTKPESPS